MPFSKNVRTILGIWRLVRLLPHRSWCSKGQKMETRPRLLIIMEETDLRNSEKGPGAWHVPVPPCVFVGRYVGDHVRRIYRPQR